MRQLLRLSNRSVIGLGMEGGASENPGEGQEERRRGRLQAGVGTFCAHRAVL